MPRPCPRARWTGTAGCASGDREPDHRDRRRPGSGVRARGSRRIAVRVGLHVQNPGLTGVEACDAHVHIGHPGGDFETMSSVSGSTTIRTTSGVRVTWTWISEAMTSASATTHWIPTARACSCWSCSPASTLPPPLRGSHVAKQSSTANTRVNAAFSTQRRRSRLSDRHRPCL